MNPAHLIAWQSDVFGQAANDRFLAEHADQLMGTGTLWQDIVANTPEYGYDPTQNIADALADAGYSVDWDNGVYIYKRG